MTPLSPHVIWTVIVGMAITNIVMRFPAIAVVSRARIPTPVMRWLSFVPSSVMGSLVALEVFTPGGRFAAPWDTPWLASAGVTALAYHLSRSFLGAAVAGMAAFAVLRYLLA